MPPERTQKDRISYIVSEGSVNFATPHSSYSTSEPSQRGRNPGVSKELNALNAVLDPLGRGLLRAKAGATLPDELLGRVSETLDGCSLVVDQISLNLNKYQRDKIWVKMKWVAFGQADMSELRSSLEAYKMALSLGFSAISM